jgi:hypothetical protein
MISAYNSTTQTINPNEAFVFDTNRILTGCTVSHTPGTSVFTLNKSGYYYVTFNTTFTTETTGEATVELKNGNVTLAGAIGTETITTAGDTKSISFSTIIKVLPSCCTIDNTVNITLVATGVAITASTAAIEITKLC